MRRAPRSPRLAGLLAGASLLASALLSTGASTALGQDQGGVGVAVPYISDEGVTLGTIELRAIDAPFKDFDANDPPDAGSQYIGLVVAFTAADDQQMEVDSNAVALLDTTGTIWTSTF